MSVTTNRRTRFLRHIDLCTELLRGKCKAVLLLDTKDGNYWLGQLGKAVRHSERMLARQLKVMEEGDLLTRKVFHKAPLRVRLNHCTRLLERC